MDNNYTIKVSNTNPFVDYNEKDLNLIPSFNNVSEFRPEFDFVEFSIYNEQGVLQFINPNFTNYAILSGFNSNTGVASTISVDPGVDLEQEGFDQGVYNVVYNFLRNKVNSSQENPYFIQEISSDRTELRLASNTLSNSEIETAVNSFISELNGSPFFEDFYLNFGDNNLSVGVNIALDDETDPDQFTILIKLYESLSPQFDLKDVCWIALQTAEAISFEVEFSPKVVAPPKPIFIKGPNLDLKIKDEANNSITFQTLDSLTSTILTSSKNELETILNNKGITIDVDYEDFNDYVYFSSAKNRLENFYYKFKQISDFQEEINIIKADITGSTSESVAVGSSLGILESKITNIVKNFDGYDRFLYYSSGSDYTWPKTTTEAPYTLATTGSNLVSNWYGKAVTEIQTPEGILGSASLYDESNPDRLVNTLPAFVKDDPTNSPFFLFVDMVGQHFDVFWTYTKAIEDRFGADNRLNKGISKDLVADAIRSMGVNLYQNNFSSDDLYSALVGINASGSLLPPTGSEIIENYVTASSDITKLDDVNKETYKRIFHNLPFLLKTKGTVTGLRALINTYGIPDTILRISEFGGKDIDNTNDWDYYQNKFSYAAYNSSSSTTSLISSSFQLNTDWNSDDDVPNTIMFRFKPEVDFTGPQTQSIVAKIGTSNSHYILFDYEGSGTSTSNYSGAIPSASNQFVSLSFNYGTGTEIAAVNAPFYDGNWWGVQLTRTGSTNEYVLRVANNIYDGNDGFKIGYTASDSGVSTGTNDGHYINADKLFLPSDGTVVSNYRGITGSFQELRYYNTVLGETQFHDYVMNPYSIEGSTFTSSADNLVFRAPLGSDLKLNTGSVGSIHPKTTGSYITSSFASDINTYFIGSDIVFPSYTQFIYYDQPAVGIKNRISEKIRVDDLVTPSGDTLSQYRTIQQRYAQSESYTRDINYLEVAFSPQDEINDDINSSFGYFNIGEYIGDPLLMSQSVNSYADLDNLRDTYFEKYYKAYDWRDYVRLIKYFDNSLFKMIRDFTPAKTSVSTGVVIKQHLLERNRQRPPVVSFEDIIYTGSTSISGSKIGTLSGGPGGVFNYLNVSGSAITASVSPQITQSWSYGVSGPSGTFILTQSSQEEYYNGEFSGSSQVATNGELNESNPYKKPVKDVNSYNIKMFRGDGTDNRGQNLINNKVGSNVSLTKSDFKSQWSSLPAIPRYYLADIPAGWLYDRTGSCSATQFAELAAENSGALEGNDASLGLTSYIAYARYSGSEAGVKYYIVSSSLRAGDIDTILVATQNNIVYNDDNYYSWFAKLKHSNIISIKPIDNPESWNNNFVYFSSSFYDYDSQGTSSSGDEYNLGTVVLGSGSIYPGGVSGLGTGASLNSKFGQGNLVQFIRDEAQIVDTHLLFRDFIHPHSIPPEGDAYLFYDTGSNLI
jgi:hypothetical protein